MNATENYSIRVEPTQNSRLSQVDFDNLKFGKILSDHMLVANYDDGEWKDVSIVPYGDISISPSMSALHYGQAIFEGIKAYKFADGTVSIFRPDRNWERFNKSAARLQMPEVPEEIFMDGLSKLLDIDRNWIPAKEGSSLYIRPFMFATEAALGVHPSKSYKFIIITGPVGAYYSKAISLKVETYYTRAAEGGVGFSKNAGNYALSLYPTQLANDEGYDQIMWTDASEHKYIEEAGTANLIFRIGDTIITPHGDTILHGVTRRTIMELAEKWGYKAEQRKVSIQELIDGIKAGTVTEAFAAGTAATITDISRIGFEGQDYHLPPVEGREFSNRVLNYLNDLRYGKVEDPFGWNYLVK
ncbi:MULTISPECIES: branched-chain amino acid aminotransferase [Sphingobacterium]|jgi:branched-chain amino acid aminotransferase|uniref:branched-chain-amino-acid transaminase n=3 Tax=Sphingobacterium TaxID=28453 RepID=A0A2X2J022_SPHMU|nr:MULTISPECIES: branched-chain amino acid aminotransferase [Sphingobacterium]APU99226.1 branched chain amino acid aminotransferase [Sphingobacterium sp. B29]KKO92233.1 branched-chain amino acid aminotransferase [Sphingobacterium sp. Ag1]MBB1644165.1 branched-chain amino acid aminotransferase [Sphingobacterium sp. UME9]MCS4168260.1 branched-chain amino acid aminotransferase [Sphingobacterium sp. BIGb0116]MDR3010190.1 branched-chain amino acid aminotransferase [Sphingobacterium sp.]